MSHRSPLPLPAAGQRFHRWTVLDSAASLRDKVRCRCDCGREGLVVGHNLVRGYSTKCRACADRLGATTHGASDRGGKQPADRLYRIWKAMKWRCNPRNLRDVERYFERGVAVSDGWATDYPAFRDWALAHGYADHLTIDRRDNGRGYSPDNCRWVDYTTQARNTGRNRLLTAFGETKSLTEWAEDPRCAVSRSNLSRRVHLGWPHAEAIARGPERASASRPKRVEPLQPLEG